MALTPYWTWITVLPGAQIPPGVRDAGAIWLLPGSYPHLHDAKQKLLFCKSEKPDRIATQNIQLYCRIFIL